MCKPDAGTPLFKEVLRLKILVMKQIKGQFISRGYFVADEGYG